MLPPVLPVPNISGPIRVSCRISPFFWGGGELKDFGGSSLGVGGSGWIKIKSVKIWGGGGVTDFSGGGVSPPKRACRKPWPMLPPVLLVPNISGPILASIIRLSTILGCRNLLKVEGPSLEQAAIKLGGGKLYCDPLASNMGGGHPPAPPPVLKSNLAERTQLFMGMVAGRGLII